MNIVSKCNTIAQFLTTRRECKKHGGYMIYEDDKIKISLDTYVPNICVYVKDGTKKVLAMIYNGAHGSMQEFHGGTWEKYIADVLYPKATQAQQLAVEVKERQDREEAEKRTARLNDSHVFGF